MECDETLRMNGIIHVRAQEDLSASVAGGNVIMHPLRFQYIEGFYLLRVGTGGSNVKTQEDLRK